MARSASTSAGRFAVQVVVYAAAVPVLYRLLYELGGRWGAVAGTLALAFGTYEMHTTIAMVSYFEVLALAALTYLLVYRAATRGLGHGGALVLGGLLGLGGWINPQSIVITGSAIVGLVAASPFRRLLESDALELRLGRARARSLRLLIGAELGTSPFPAPSSMTPSMSIRGAAPAWPRTRNGKL